MKALLLALALSGCSLRTEAPLLIESYSCNWQLASDETTEPDPGLCWSIRPEDADGAAMTLASVSGPCGVNGSKVAKVGPGTHIRVWVRSFRVNRNPDVRLTFAEGPCE